MSSKAKNWKKVVALLSVFALLFVYLPMSSVSNAEEGVEPTNRVDDNDIPVILYHRIVTTASNQWTDTSITNFKAHIDYLQENGYTTLSADEYVNILQGKATAPAKPILLTFDDATPDFVSTVLPYLEGKSMKCVLFVVSDWIGAGYSMSQAQLKDIADNHPSVSIESHSKTHSDTVWTDTMTYQSAFDELTAAKTYIEGITGKDPVLFAWPYGISNVDARAAAYDTGIQYAFKVGTPNDGAYKMARVYTLDVSVADFAASIGGPAPQYMIYHETFADGIGAAKVSGGVSLTRVTGKVFDGNADGTALYLSNRTYDYDAADFNFSDLGLVNGKTYKVTVKGYVDSDATVPSGSQAFLQTVGSYGWLGGADLVAGQAFTLTGNITVDTSKDSRIRIQSNSEASNVGKGATVPFYVGDILITSTEAPTQTEPSSGAQVYHETFANGKGIATESGDVSLTTASGVVFEGNDDEAALYLNNRSETWDAADFTFAGLGLENGKTYKITIKGYVGSDVTVPEGSQAALQPCNPATNQYGSWIDGKALAAGGAFTLSGTYTVDSATYDRLRILSDENGKTVPFYVGDILITGEGSATSPSLYSNEFEDANVKDFFQSGTATLSVSSEQKSGRTQSLKVVTTGSQPYDGAQIPASAAGVELGKKYHVSAKVYAPDQPVQLIMQVVLTKASDGTTDWKWLANKTYDTGATGWSTFEGDLDLTDGTYSAISNIQFVKGSTTNVAFYVDDFTVTDLSGGSDDSGDDEPATPAEPFTTITFEDQTTGGFVARGGVETVAVSDEANHTTGGTYSLKTTGRKENWQGPSLDVAKYIDKGSKYKVTLWAKLITPSSVELDLSTQLGSSSYPNITKKRVSTSDGWVQISGDYTYGDIPEGKATIYLQSSTVSAEYYIDDVSFEKIGGAPTTIETDITGIKDVYDPTNDFLIGTAIVPTDLSGLRFDLLKKHFNIATAGNAMKPESLEKVKGTWTWTEADNMVQKVLDAGLQMHGHVLAWHSQSPNWLNMRVDGSGNALKDSSGNIQYLTREEALTNMRDYITTVINHFGNKVISWDVVNEAMSDNPSNPTDWKSALRKSPWYYAIGDDYVEQAFLIARGVIDANPALQGIKLYYNDYNEDNQNKATAIASMVKELNDKYGATHSGKKLIDGIGMQAHYNLSTNPDNVLASLEKFISLGVTISVSELDVMAGSNSTLTADEAKAQAYLYAQLFKMYKEHAANIERVTIWGMDDGESWRKENSPLPFDANLQHKAAYDAIIAPATYMAENPPPKLPDAKQGKALFGTPIIDGTIDSIWSGAPAMEINQYLQAWQGATGTVKAMWDNSNLYLLYQVNNAVLDKSSANAWEQDSVEAFVDENNHKTPSYESDDGQYRVNYANEASFNPSSISAGFESAATTGAGANFTIEMKIPFKTITPAENTKIGFDSQINDGEAGSRISTATWNDIKGVGYQDTSVYGVLTLVKSISDGKDSTPGTTAGGSQDNTTVVGTKDGKSVATVTPTAPDSNGGVKANVDTNTLNSLVSLAKDAESKGQNAVIEIKVGSPATAKEVSVDLPKDAMVKLTQDTKATLKIDTGVASVMFDTKALKSMSGQLTGANVNVKAAKVDTSSLPQDVKAKVGDRPVFDISVTSGNTKLTNFEGGKLQISFPYIPKSSENRNAIIVNYIGSDGKLNTVRGRYDEATGTVICVTTHLSTYAVGYNNVSFKDIKAETWYRNAVSFIAARGITDGIGNGMFGGEKNLTRAEFLVMLMRAYQIAPDANASANFADAGNTYYTGYLAAAKRLGISDGIGGNKFAPDKTITRQEMFTLLYNALKSIDELPSAKTGKAFTSFDDSSNVAQWAKEAIKSLTEAGIINGVNGRLDPYGTAKRSESAQTLYNLLKG